MKRVRLTVQTTYHPDAGGSRRLGEVFDLSNELADHWMRNAIADDATGEPLTAPLIPAEPDAEDVWSDEYPDAGEATLEGAVLNSDDRPLGVPQDSPSIVGDLGPRKQRRPRR